LAEAFSLTSSTVRQDLSYLKISGRARCGYRITELERILGSVLGVDNGWKAVIIGAGNLGRALALHGAFGRQGFEICGIFDAEPRLFGKKCGQLTVQQMSDLPDMVRQGLVDIGIIAVPAAAAQTVAGQLAEAGVRGILNLTCAHVSVPEGVTVINARIVESLQELSYALKLRGKKK